MIPSQKGEAHPDEPFGRGPGVRLKVIDTKKDNDLIIHVVEQFPPEFSGDVLATVNKEKKKTKLLCITALHTSYMRRYVQC